MSDVMRQVFFLYSLSMIYYIVHTTQYIVMYLYYIVTDGHDIFIQHVFRIRPFRCCSIYFTAPKLPYGTDCSSSPRSPGGDNLVVTGIMRQHAHLCDTSAVPVVIYMTSGGNLIVYLLDISQQITYTIMTSEMLRTKPTLRSRNQNMTRIRMPFILKSLVCGPILSPSPPATPGWPLLGRIRFGLRCNKNTWVVRVAIKLGLIININIQY